MNYTKISDERKHILLKRIGYMYRTCEMHMQVRGGFLMEEESSLYKFLEVKGRVDIALKRLSLEHALIIRKEYLENTRDNWYLEYFESRLYKRLQKDALDRFLRCLYG